LTAQLGVAGTVRASFYVYNTFPEVDRLLETLQDIIQHALL
jgi:selenocysteine lyase/cysteine desulfurase